LHFVSKGAHHALGMTIVTSYPAVACQSRSLCMIPLMGDRAAFTIDRIQLILPTLSAPGNLNDPGALGTVKRLGFGCDR
jgi:hypothetical protein